MTSANIITGLADLAEAAYGENGVRRKRGQVFQYHI